MTMLMIMTLALMAPVVLIANEDNGTTQPPPSITIPRSQWDEMVREVERLASDNADLRNQLQNRPEATPPPVFAPNPRLVGPQSVTLEAGQSTDIAVIVRNIGSHSAFNLLTQASSTGPFTLQFLGASNSVSTLSENRDATMMLRITADDNAEPGNHAVTLNHSFRNQARENATTNDTFSVRIGGVAGTSNISLSNFRQGDFRGLATAVEPGQTFTINANIQNLGTAAARDVRITVPSLTDNMIFPTSDPVFYDTLEGGYSGNISFTFATSDNITSGNYTITFQVSARGETQPQEFTTVVNVHSPEDDTQASLEIRNLTAPTGRLNVNQHATISFYVVNMGDADARNIRVEATPEDPRHIFPVVTARTQTIPLLEPGQAQQLSFTFFPGESAETRSYAIGFNVSFTEGTGSEAGTQTFEQFSAINVYNPDADDADEGRIQIPRVIVSAHSIYPRIPLAGQTFEMDITFQNTSSSRSVNNVVITLEALEAVRDQGTVFTPHDGSNTMFIGYIPPGGEVTRSMSWFTVPDASPRSYPIRVSFEYQDQDFREHSFQENLNINVQQVVRLELSEMHIPPQVMLGNSIFLQMQIINSGMVLLRNMRVRVEGPFDTSEANMFISNISPGAFRNYTGSIVPLEEGRISGQFIVYGEDATGATVEFPTDFTVEVTGGFGDIGFGGDRGGWDDWDDGLFAGGGDIWGDDTWGDHGGYDGGEGGFMAMITRPIVWGPVLAIVAITAVTIVLVIRRKKNKLDFDDDDL